jgi:hypothetical protein
MTAVFLQQLSGPCSQAQVKVSAPEPEPELQPTAAASATQVASKARRANTGLGGLTAARQDGARL